MGDFFRGTVSGCWISKRFMAVLGNYSCQLDREDFVIYGPMTEELWGILF